MVELECSIDVALDWWVPECSGDLRRALTVALVFTTALVLLYQLDPLFFSNRLVPLGNKNEEK